MDSDGVRHEVAVKARVRGLRRGRTRRGRQLKYAFRGDAVTSWRGTAPCVPCPPLHMCAGLDAAGASVRTVRMPPVNNTVGGRAYLVRLCELRPLVVWVQV